MATPARQVAPPDIRAATRARYLDALRAATSRPASRCSNSALDSFLSLNAAYFLGEWLPAAPHRTLVHRFVARLDGLAGLSVPAEPWTRAQLAQHVRELAAAFDSAAWADADGAPRSASDSDRTGIGTQQHPWHRAAPVDAAGVTDWLKGMAALTVDALPVQVEDWDASIWAAAGPLATGAGRPLLLAHARRRLWALTHPEPPAIFVGSIEPNLLYRITRAAARSSGFQVQVAEAALAEISEAPHLAGVLFPAIRDLLPRSAAG